MMLSPPDIEIINISKSFAKKIIFDKLSYKIPAKSKIKLVGANGIGKTTLLSILAKILTPDSGEITSTFASNISFLPERDNGFFPKLTGAENIAIFSRFFKNQKTDYAEIIQELFLKNKTFQIVLSTPFEKQSSGMKKMLQFYTLLINTSDILLLDEPFNKLDQENVNFIKEILKAYYQEATLVIIDHNEDTFYESFQKLDLESLC